MSIIYVYNTQLFYEHLYSYQTNNDIKLCLELILFIFFGVVLLFIVVLSFKALAKFIVIPIKNVQYMLKGINIGGENRLEYLNTLRHTQEESLENEELLKSSKRRRRAPVTKKMTRRRTKRRKSTKISTRLQWQT